MPEPRKSDVPRPARLMRLVADQVEQLGDDITYEALNRTLVGEALSRKEIEGMANDRAAVDEFIAGCRTTADRWEELNA